MALLRLFCSAVVAAALAIAFAPFALADDPTKTVTPADEPVDQATDKTGEQPAEDNSARPLRYRRIFAPADRVQDWPRGRVRYVPVDAMNSSG